MYSVHQFKNSVYANKEKEGNDSLDIKQGTDTDSESYVNLSLALANVNNHFGIKVTTSTKQLNNKMSI